MTKLEELHQTAYDENIHIHNYSFSETKKGACVQSGDYKAIALDKPAITSSAEETAILAEELAHYETGTLYMIEATANTPLAKSNRAKYEAVARRRAIMNVISFDELCEAVHKGNYELYEIAEYLNLPEDFVLEAIELYERKGMYLK